MESNLIEEIVEAKLHRRLGEFEEHAQSVREAENQIREEVVKSLTDRAKRYGTLAGVPTLAALIGLVIFLYQRVDTAARNAAKATAERIAADELRNQEERMQRASKVVEQLYTTTVNAMVTRIEELGRATADLSRVRELLPELGRIDMTSAKQNAALLADNEGRIRDLLALDEKVAKVESIGYEANRRATGTLRAHEQLLPVGTVISSMLAPDRFRELVGDGDSFDPEKSTWAPADGRSVKGSQYARFGAEVPDLRGVFLRGLNAFGPVKGRSDGRGDPDGARAAGSWQPDQLRAHEHHLVANQSVDVNVKDYSVGVEQSLALENDQGGANIRSYKLIGVNAPADLGRTSEEGGQEARPRNVALYFYVKINQQSFAEESDEG